MTSTEGNRYAIRRCTPDDAESIAALGARLFVQAYGPTHPEPELGRYLAGAYSIAAIADAMVRNGSSVFVVEDAEGAPLAYAHQCLTHEIPAGVNGRRTVEIVRFYVDNAYQGRGIGAALMNHCCDFARQAGADVIWLQVWSQAPWAIGFYRRMGFEIVGKKPFYFGDRVDEDHVMARTL